MPGHVMSGEATSGKAAAIADADGDHIWTRQSWLDGATLASLAELNEQSLELLCEQARQPCALAAPALLADLRDLWRDLDAGARRRAAHCPYLLVDVGFAMASRWNGLRGTQVNDCGRPAVLPFFTAPRSAEVVRTALTYAWHLARSQRTAARLLLGMSAQCADLIGACSLRRIAILAERHPEWLQPRWPGQLRVWRELLATAITGGAAALERVQVRGLPLLAAQTRAAGPS